MTRTLHSVQADMHGMCNAVQVTQSVFIQFMYIAYASKACAEQAVALIVLIRLPV